MSNYWEGGKLLLLSLEGNACSICLIDSDNKYKVMRVRLGHDASSWSSHFSELSIVWSFHGRVDDFHFYLLCASISKYDVSNYNIFEAADFLMLQHNCKKKKRLHQIIAVPNLGDFEFYFLGRKKPQHVNNNIKTCKQTLKIFCKERECLNMR